MSEIKDLTFQEIAEHNTKKDLYLIVHDKVYDCTSFVDEHPYVGPIYISLSPHGACNGPPGTHTVLHLTSPFPSLYR